MAARVVFVIARFADRKDARDVILGAVRDSRPEARAVAAAVAKDLPSEVSDRVLLPLLGDENVGVRRSAVLAVRAENGAPVREKLAGMGATEPADLLRREIASKLKGIR
jgi:HEAT repeat protein